MMLGSVAYLLVERAARAGGVCVVEWWRGVVWVGVRDKIVRGDRGVYATVSQVLGGACAHRCSLLGRTKISFVKS